MPTLLLRCVAPLQSWGTQSRYSIRDTAREPSKSGIVGLLCAALGRPRTADVADLSSLNMGVRVDREGSVLREWQTAKATDKGDATISTRYYLNEAAFLVGLEGEDVALLQALHAALRSPRWSLFLGRKSCPPAVSPYLQDGLQDSALLDALYAYPWLGVRRDEYARLTQLRLVVDDAQGVEVRGDLPVSFADRVFRLRRVRTSFMLPPPFWRASAQNADGDVQEEDEENVGENLGVQPKEVKSCFYRV